MALTAAMLWLAAAGAATPQPARLAVVVSANDGLASDAPLHFADDDGDRVAAVLRDLGGVGSEDLFRVREATVDGLTTALGHAVLRASALRDAGRPTTLVLYYTGHAAADGLHLSGEVLPLLSLKTAARVVPADERVFIVDACQAGQILRSKGATLVQVHDRPEEFSPPADEAWIASTGPEERAFEVDRRRGALFTHFFVSGARGAADLDQDGQVTLGELYGFVQAQTEVAAAGLGVVQRPRWAGALEAFVVTDPGSAGSGLEAVGPVPEPLLVVDVGRGAVAAEVPAGAGGRLALPPGRYQLLALGPGRRTRVADIDIPEAGFSEVAAADMHNSRGIRTKGGLVDPHPWNVAAGYAASVGTTPGRADGHAAWLGLRQSLGRGHRGEFGVEIGRMTLATAHASGRNQWGGARAQWGYDLWGHALRAGPGLEVAAGWLQQDVARAPHAVWGAWYGDDLAARSTQAAYGRLLVGLSGEAPAGPITLIGFAGVGASAFSTAPVQLGPMAQARLGVAVGR